MCYLLIRKLPKAKITRKQRKNMFLLIKNEDEIVGDHLNLYFHYINEEQFVVMYLELIFTGIKTRR